MVRGNDISREKNFTLAIGTPNLSVRGTLDRGTLEISRSRANSLELLGTISGTFSYQISRSGGSQG